MLKIKNQILTRFLMVSLSFISSLAFAGAVAKAPTLIGSSGKTRVKLVELFSSESCSSCPPAEDWISRMEDRPDLWKNFVPVVFHVDYWNHLGWKDKLSSPLMTDRQRDISDLWAKPSVYTPAFVVDGKEWHPAGDFPASPTSDIELSVFKNFDGSLTLKAKGLKAGVKYKLNLAELGMGLSNRITGGENSGRTLKHDFVILNWETKLMPENGSEQNFAWVVPKEIAEKTAPTRFAVAAWIEDASKPISLQAVGGYL